uniref:Frizzled/Smoothened transmembrane domain-containing protein n=1 Tax=Mesocestoides corti TaxID=53468 RepID=A0A5K3FEB1_MESCO
MGLDGVSASTVCRNPASATSTFYSEVQFNSQVDGGGGVRVERNSSPLRFPSDYPPASLLEDDVAIHKKPLTGPLLLNLFTYLMVNLVFASMCLLDRAVKRKWLDLARGLFSVCTSCPTKHLDASRCLEQPPLAVPSDPHTFHLPPSFSWWDPGVFFLSPPRKTSALATTTRQCRHHDTTTTTSVSPLARHQTLLASTTATTQMRPLATSDVSCACNRRYSSSTNEESWIMPSVLSSVGLTNTASIARRGGGVGGNTSSVVISNATSAAAAPMHKSNSLNSSQSLFASRRGRRSPLEGETLFNPLSSSPSHRDEANMATVTAAALEHTLTRSGRRSRHRRMWPGKSSSSRRRFCSRSYSTVGLASAGSADRRSLRSLLSRPVLNRAASSSRSNRDGGGGSQRNLSIDSLSRLCAAAAA